MLQKIKEEKLKCNIETYFFGWTEMEYLGFWVNRTGIRPVNEKSEAIVKMIPPTTKHQVRDFIVLIKFYRDMRARRSHLIQPLTKLTLDRVNFKWTSIEQKSFDDIKLIVASNTLLEYPYFNKQFYIHMNAS